MGLRHVGVTEKKRRILGRENLTVKMSLGGFLFFIFQFSRSGLAGSDVRKLRAEACPAEPCLI